LLREGFHLLTYDPYYQPDKSILKKSYNYIVSCEVVEHFNKPQETFLLLKQLLKPKGKLYIKTDILYYVNRMYFEKWGYRNDPTHVFFYTPKTFEYIKQTFDFTELQLKNRTVILRS
jgi:cyclopropane fatty-acyl-phospholipid synthase-like methyltransferase